MTEHPDWIAAEIPNSRRCLEELKEIQGKIVNRLPSKFDFLDFGLDIREANSIDRDLVPIARSCIWHAIALKAEFKLKLAYVIDSYLTAVASKNPFSTFLLARYLLELVATISEVDFDLEDCAKLELEEWARRATIFQAILYRARTSTSDEKVKAAFARLDIPPALFHPIKISRAIKRLSSRYGFSSARSLYQSFSNFSHHNGSGHKFLASDARMTTALVLPSGKPIFLEKEAPVITIEYPATSFATIALAHAKRRAGPGPIISPGR